LENYMNRKSLYLVLGLVGLMSVASSAIAAGNLNLNYETLANPLSTPINQALTTTINNIPSTLSVPDTFFYGKSFTTPTPYISNVANGTTYGFVDTYVFTITSAQTTSVTTTVNLGDLYGITNLQERLYAWSGTPYSTGTPPGGSIQGWTTVNPAGPGVTISNAVINQTGLAAGTYALEIRGNASGLAGGSYSGVLNLGVVPAVVPVPSAIWLFGSALAGLVGVRRKKQSV
jgi:hypothetical protein